MSRCHSCRSSSRSSVPGFVPLALALSLATLAGCSADIRRLEQPAYALGEKPPLPSEPINRRAASLPAAQDSQAWSDAGRTSRVTALNDATAPANPSIPFDAPKKAKPAATAAPAAPARSTIPVAAGSTIEIQPGDSLYGLSKRHNVSIGALMELNQLKTQTLQPGQKIVLPATARRPLVKPTTAIAAAPQPAQVGVPVATPAPVKVATLAAAAPVVPAAAAAPAAPSAATDWDGSYVVKSGDSLFGIARSHKVNGAELQRVNGITDPAKMKPGMTLKVPAASVAIAAAAASAPPVVAAPVAAPVAEAPQAVAPAAPAAVTSGGPRLLNPPADVAQTTKPVALVPTTKVAGPATATAPAVAAHNAAKKFRWPARGTILAGFGKRPDGAHNDGINVAVAAGTEIHASEAGTVAYAGGEIKAYGNLVLIRHEGGWVTAYAHADQILVKRGDAVTRGQVIAKAGATGSVDQPQVHFELREGSKPVDPAPHMEK